MPFIPVPDTFEVNMHYLLDGQNVHNIFGVHPTAVGPVFDMEAVAEHFAVWFTSDMKDNLSSSIALQDVTIKPLSEEGLPGLVWATGLPATGARDIQSLPNNCALCVTLRTGNTGRSFRGRSYVAGICETDSDRSRINPALVAQIVASYNSLIDDLPGAVGAELVVISRNHNKAPRTTGVFTPITSAGVFDNVVDSQRRRLPGRGT